MLRKALTPPSSLCSDRTRCVPIMSYGTIDSLPALQRIRWTRDLGGLALYRLALVLCAEPAISRRLPLATRQILRPLQEAEESRVCCLFDAVFFALSAGSRASNHR